MNLLFPATVAWLVVHELDAVRRRERRVFLAPPSVRDETAYRVFVAAHVPVVVLVP